MLFAQALQVVAQAALVGAHCVDFFLGDRRLALVHDKVLTQGIEGVKLGHELRGFGLEGLIQAIEKSLPHPSVEITAVIPYSRGDLVSAIHERGEILSEEHLAEGTSIHAYVDGGLARSIEDATQIAPS